MTRKRIFSGVQPTGDPHIGNYFGAILNWVDLQDDYDCIFCIVDQHAITVYQQPEELRQKSLEVAALYMACGIDPKKSRVYVQSMMRQHTELAWILGCYTSVGWLNRMTQFKSKSSAAATEFVSAGLYNYPVLMAADILLYNAAIVPVGDDQSQHLELTREIAERFNSLYGPTFNVPETKLPKLGARVMGFDDPEKKMSKSEAHKPGHSIGILDDPKTIEKTVKRAVTDSGSEIVWDESKAGLFNLLTIYQRCTRRTREEIVKEFEGKMYGHLKAALAEVLIGELRPVREKYHELMKDKGEIMRFMKESVSALTPWADETMKTVRNKIGFAEME